jgi:hypothetical protein
LQNEFVTESFHNINKIQTLLQTTNIIGLCILKFEIRKFLKFAWNYRIKLHLILILLF